MRNRTHLIGVAAAATVILTACTAGTPTVTQTEAQATESAATAAPSGAPTAPQSANPDEGEVSVFDLTPGMCSSL
nr:hypothetical protein [Actinomycetales bacterium]